MVAPRKDFNDFVPVKELAVGDFVLFIADDQTMPTGQVIAITGDTTVLIQELKSGCMHTILRKNVARIRTEFPKGPCERLTHAS